MGERADFKVVLDEAVRVGFIGLAVVAGNGMVVEVAGELTMQTAERLAVYLTSWLDDPDVAPRLYADEVITISVDDRHVSIARAKGELFVIAVLGAGTAEELALVAALCDAIADLLDTRLPRRRLPIGGSDSGSGSGPAHLALVEYGITVPRGKA